MSYSNKKILFNKIFKKQKKKLLNRFKIIYKMFKIIYNKIMMTDFSKQN